MRGDVKADRYLQSVGKQTLLSLLATLSTISRHQRTPSFDEEVLLWSQHKFAEHLAREQILKGLASFGQRIDLGPRFF